MKKYFYPQFVSQLPEAVLRIFSVFGDNNIRLVGGCVRDLIIEKKVNDYDFACVFLPEKIVEILNHSGIKNIATGLKYGTITAVIDEQNFQITTLRKDKNQRGRDCDVDFTNDYMIDASRRDFTINALYLDEKGYIYDYFNGFHDLKNREVKFINNCAERIQEDYLRIMRFLRFSCFYAQKIDTENLSSVIFYKNSLLQISKERIREEFYKIINCQNFSKVAEVLKILHQHNFDLILWNSLIDDEAYGKLQKYRHQIAADEFLELAIAAIFWHRAIDFKGLVANLKLTNHEKKIFSKYFKLLDFYGNSPINNNEINKLLLQNDQNFVTNFLILGHIKNIWSIAADDFNALLLYVKNKAIPVFPVQISELKSLDCPDYCLSDIMNKLKAIWATNDFNISKENLNLLAIKLIKENNAK